MLYISLGVAAYKMENGRRRLRLRVSPLWPLPLSSFVIQMTFFFSCPHTSNVVFSTLAPAATRTKMLKHQIVSRLIVARRISLEGVERIDLGINWSNSTALLLRTKKGRERKIVSTLL